MRLAPRPIVRYLGGLGRRLAASQDGKAEEAKGAEPEAGAAPAKRPDGKPKRTSRAT